MHIKFQIEILKQTEVMLKNMLPKDGQYESSIPSTNCIGRGYNDFKLHEGRYLVTKAKKKLECAASNGNRYPPYPQVMATAISQ